MLEKAKLTLRIKTDGYDEEISDLIFAAAADLGIAGVTEKVEEMTDPLIVRAILTYVKMNFGSADDYDRLKASYDEQKAQLSMATGYTNWG